MKKRNTLALSALALSLALVACTPEGGTEHVHSFSKWGNDENSHWQYCEADNAIDEQSKTAHSDTNTDGVCDVCGYEMRRVSSTIASFGGEILLVKAGNERASGAGVTMTLSDAYGVVEMSDLVINNNGTFSFSAPEGKYTLCVSKDGYTDYEAKINVTKEQTVSDYTVKLQYNLLQVAPIPAWDASGHDFTKQNDGYVVLREGSTLNFITTDSYDDVICTYYAKKGQSTNSNDRIGVWVQFYDESNSKVDCVWLSTYGAENRVEWYDGGFWGDNMTNLISSGSGFAMTEQEQSQFERGTLKVGLARSGNKLYALVNGEIRDTIQLSAKYANMDCYIGMVAWDCVLNEDIHFSIDSFDPEATSMVTDTTIVKSNTETLDFADSKYAWWEIYGEEKTTSSEKGDICRSNVMDKALCNWKFTYDVCGNSVAVNSGHMIQKTDSFKFEFTVKKGDTQVQIWLDAAHESSLVTVDYETNVESGCFEGNGKGAFIRIGVDTSDWEDGESRTLKVTVSSTDALGCIAAAVM